MDEFIKLNEVLSVVSLKDILENSGISIGIIVIFLITLFILAQFVKKIFINTFLLILTITPLCLSLEYTLLTATNLLQYSTQKYLASDSKSQCSYTYDNIIIASDGILTPEVPTPETLQSLIKAIKLVENRSEKVKKIIILESTHPYMTREEAHLIKKFITMLDPKSNIDVQRIFVTTEKYGSFYEYVNTLTQNLNSHGHPQKTAILIANTHKLARITKYLEHNNVLVCPINVPAPSLKSEGFFSLANIPKTLTLFKEYIHLQYTNLVFLIPLPTVWRMLL